MCSNKCSVNRSELFGGVFAIWDFSSSFLKTFTSVKNTFLRFPNSYTDKVKFKIVKPCSTSDFVTVALPFRYSFGSEKHSRFLRVLITTDPLSINKRLI